MKLEEWIKRYDERTPDVFRHDSHYELLFDEDKGFVEVKEISLRNDAGNMEQMLIVRALCGDGRYWKKTIERIGRNLGCTVAGTWCIRKEILAYIRLFNFKVLYTEVLRDGTRRYHCENKSDGKWGNVSPAFRFGTGEQAYYITWQI